MNYKQHDAVLETNGLPKIRTKPAKGIDVIVRDDRV